MGGIEIQYLLGLYFIVISISFAAGRVSADAVRLIAGVVFFVMAVIGFSFIR